MTAPLVDPTLARWQASDPAAFLDGAPPPLAPSQPLHSRSDIERDLAVAFVVTVALVVRDLHRRHCANIDDAAENVDGAWRRNLPMWVRLSSPAIKQAYVLGRVDGTPEEIEILAREYAEDLGTYVGQTSGEAMLEGFQRQLNQRWSADLAYHRAAAAYGLDKQQMNTYLATAAAGERDGDLVTPSARALVDRLLLARATRIAHDQAYTAEQTGKVLVWMRAYAAGEIPGATRRWRLGADEHHCTVCTTLAGQEVAPDQQFTVGGVGIWAPRAHPGCSCEVELVMDGRIIAKAGPVAAGVCLVAADTGRVLLLQRMLDDRDPAGGKWEFPGGHVERGEEPIVAAKREWEEEVHRRLPSDARYVSRWSGGPKYEGFVFMVPDESCVPSHRRGRVVNPDDPDGDQIEAIAWWDPAHLGSPVMRDELRESRRDVSAAIRESRIAKIAPDDPYDRDSHGRFAAGESRRVTTLERPDPTVAALVRSVAATKPESLTSGRSLTAGRSLTGSTRSLTGSRNLTEQRSLTAGPLMSLTQQIATERQRQLRPSIRVNIRVPVTPKSPTPDDRQGGSFRRGNFVNYGDIERYFQGSGMPLDSVDFRDVRAYARAAGADGVPNPHARVVAHIDTDGWNATYPPVDTDDWNDLMETGKAVWNEAVTNYEDYVPDLLDGDLDAIFSMSGYGTGRTERQMTKMLMQELGPDGDPDDRSLRDAYGDYMTWHRADLVDPSFSQHLAATFGDDRDQLEQPAVALRIDDLAGDDPQDMKGYYEVENSRYYSALAEGWENVPRGHVSLVEMRLAPARRGDGYRPSPE